MLDLRTLLQEVGRRHVARVAVIYSAMAFGVLEAADIVIPALGLPAWTIRFIIGLALLGFPVTLVLAWVYDLTPRGVVRTQAHEEGDRDEHMRRSLGHPLLSAFLLLLSGALVAAGAFYTFQWSHLAPGGAASADPASSADLNPLRVAVLPFSDLDNQDGGSFADGIQGDILNQLMKIGSLEVISRTTALLYRNTEKPVPEIGRELNAGSILTGSVRRQGDRVRVVAELTDARTDRQIWSDTYDEEQSDILQVQSDIARDIALALGAELKPGTEPQPDVEPTVNPEAYQRYWEGIDQWDLRENRMNAFQAVDLFREATEIDPDYAQAWASLSQARMWLFWNFPGAQDQAELAAEARDRAVELAPNSAETLLAQGYFYFYGRGDVQAALQYFREAEALKPGDAEVITAIGLILRGQDEWEGALAAFEQAQARDFRSYNLIYTLGDTYLRMRRYDDAQRYFHRAVVLAPEAMAAHRSLLRTRLVATGEIAAGQEYIDQLPRSASPMLRSALAADLAYYRGDLRAALTGGAGRGDQAGVGPPGGGAGMARGHERLAVIYHLLGEEELCRAHADSLRLSAQATLDAAASARGAVQTGVVARAHAKLGIANALLGESLRAVAEGSKAVSTLPVTVDAYEGGDHVRDLILIYTLIGAPDLAIQELEGALAVPSPLTRAELLLDPVFASLRDQPGFASLRETVR